MQQLFQDSMCLVTHFGKPDLFVTFTANSRWEEVTAALFTDQTVADRPDIIARVCDLNLGLPPAQCLLSGPLTPCLYI
jgi:hypothetical protein